MRSGIETSLYIHIPFCAGGKCDYCDFYSVPFNDGDSRPGRFIEKLLLEAEQVLNSFRPARVPTLYIGGGTPSSLGSAGILRLLRGLSGLIGRFSPPPEEITLEVNPESADEAFLAAAREGGATRLSLGIQSFYGPSRRAVHRNPPPGWAGFPPGLGMEPGADETFLRGRLALAAAYFSAAFSADLMSGLPLQNKSILLDDVAALLSYRPAHVSLYALTLEPGTPLALKAASSSAASFSATPSFLPGRDEADDLWLCGRDALEKSGYGQYEVSNFCLAGKESRHNVRYWRMQNWLALGPAASGTIIDDATGTGFRYTVPPDVDAWLEMPPELLSAAITGRRSGGRAYACFPITEELDSPTLIKESFLMGFRYTEGPDEDLFHRRFHREILDLIPKTKSVWRERGLLRKDKAALTKEGLLFLDPFLLDAFQELDSSRSELDSSRQ